MLGDGVLIAAVVLLITPFVFRKNPAFRYHGKFIFFYLITSTVALALLPYFLFTWRTVHNARLAAVLIAYIVPKLIGVDFELRNKEILSEDRGAVIVANHQNALDILGEFAIWHIPYKITAVAKRELFYIWPFGLGAWFAGLVFIDRSNARSSYKLLSETAKLTREDKVKVWFFAEGTRNKKANQTKKLLPLKRGAFKMAVDCQVPVIPLVYSPYYFLDVNTYRFNPGKIIMKALPPIDTKGLSEEDIPDLMDRTAKIMQETYSELFSEIEKSLPSSHPFLTGKTST